MLSVYFIFSSFWKLLFFFPNNLGPGDIDISKYKSQTDDHDTINEPVTVFNILHSKRTLIHFFGFFFCSSKRQFIYLFLCIFYAQQCKCWIELNFSCGCGNKNEIVKEQWIQKSSNGCSVLRLKLPPKKQQQQHIQNIYSCYCCNTTSKAIWRRRRERKKMKNRNHKTNAKKNYTKKNKI